MLPFSTVGEGGISLVDSLFTSTSAVCVTGLIVKDTGSFFTPFGRWVLFFLFQAGGLGIMTFSTLFAVLLGRKLGFYQTDTIRSTLDHSNIIGFKKLLTYILTITFVVEAVGALFFFLRWRAITDWPFWKTVENSIFHAVSGFCNAGFSLFRTSLIDFQQDPVINITMMLLIFFGGIGFIVLMDILGFFKSGTNRKFSLQSKIALWASGILIFAGAAALLFFDKNAAFASLAWPGRIMGAFFQSVTARTAGFNTMNIGGLSTPSLLVLTALMFVGASPGSTGGGIKTCTFAVVMAAIWGMLTNKSRVTLFGRSVPREVVRESFVIFFLSAGIVVFATVGMTFVSSFELTSVLFEVTSAFGTVGLSTGITSDLSSLEKLLVTAIMFTGRLGPLTLALALSFREKKANLIYPEETLMVG